MIQHNLDHGSPVNSVSSDLSVRSGNPPVSRDLKLTTRSWPFTAAARFTVVGSGDTSDIGASSQSASSFIT
jgi:hypothetical protein